MKPIHCIRNIFKNTVRKYIKGRPEHNWIPIRTELQHYINGFERFDVFKCANCGRTGSKLAVPFVNGIPSDGYGGLLIDTWDGTTFDGRPSEVICNPEHYPEFREQYDLPIYYKDCSKEYKTLYVITYGQIQ